MASAMLPGKTLPRLVHIARARRRLFVAALIGFATIFALPAQWEPVTRALVGWDTGIAIYLIVAFFSMSHADSAGIRRRAAREDEGKLTILTVAAALASIGAIVLELSDSRGSHPTHLALLLAVVTILLSWTFIQTIFALHYAHEFFGEGSDHREGGLQFPGEGEPDYWDFVYFSFVLGMTFQVSDVSITSRVIRRLAAAHGIVAFVFNTALLALMVNIAASAI